MTPCWILTVLALFAAQDPPSDRDWPQWRGPVGLGVSDCDSLPIRWSADSSETEWQVDVPGKGMSSPIALGGRVYLTTAWEAVENRALLDRGQLGLALLLATGLAACMVFRRNRSSRSRLAFAIGSVAALASLPLLGNDLSHWTGSGRPLETGLLLAGSLAIVATLLAPRIRKRSRPRDQIAGALPIAAAWALHLGPLSPRYRLLALTPWVMIALLMTVRPLDLAGLRRNANDSARWVCWLVPLAIGAASAWSPERYWPESSSFHVWGRSTGVLCLGLVAVCDAWLPGRSRRVGSGVLLLVGVASVTWTPTGGMGETVALWKRLLSSSPAWLGSAWLLFTPRRVAEANATASSAPPVGPRLVAIGTAVLCLVIFARANYWQPRLRTHAVVLCRDLATGAALWQRTVGTSETGALGHHLSSHATPTPCARGNRVYADFGTTVACLDTEGSVVWAREEPGFVERSVYGAGSSPLLFEDLLIVVRERERGPSHPPSTITALDTASGAPCWQVQLADGQDSYCTPILIDDGTGAQLVTASWRLLLGFDPRTGQELWRTDVPAEEVVTSLVHEAGVLILAGGSHKGINAAFELRGVQAPRRLWQSRRGTPSCSSPLLIEGRLYTLTETGMLNCFDARSGEVHWRERLGGGKYTSSLIAGCGALYASDDTGSTCVVALGDEFRLLARNGLEDAIHASPAAARDRLLFRTSRQVGGVRNPLIGGEPEG